MSIYGVEYYTKTINLQDLYDIEKYNNVVNHFSHKPTICMSEDNCPILFLGKAYGFSGFIYYDWSYGFTLFDPWLYYSGFNRFMSSNIYGPLKIALDKELFLLYSDLLMCSFISCLLSTTVGKFYARYFKDTINTYITKVQEYLEFTEVRDDVYDFMSLIHEESFDSSGTMSYKCGNIISTVNLDSYDKIKTIKCDDIIVRNVFKRRCIIAYRPNSVDVIVKRCRDTCIIYSCEEIYKNINAITEDVVRSSIEDVVKSSIEDIYARTLIAVSGSAYDMYRDIVGSEDPKSINGLLTMRFIKSNDTISIWE